MREFSSFVIIALAALVIVVCTRLLFALIPARIAQSKGHSTALFVIFGFFFWLLALIVSLCLPNQKPAPPATVVNVPQAPTFCSSDEIIVILKHYKALLEKGVITQDEFEEKKKELLKL